MRWLTNGLRVVAFSVLTSLSITEVRGRTHGLLYINTSREELLSEAHRLAVTHHAIAPHIDDVELEQFEERIGHLQSSLESGPSEGGPTRPGPRLSAIVPVFNEATFLRALLTQLTVLGGELSLEAVVVDDGSVDDTVAQFGKGAEGLSLVRRRSSGGYVSAIRDGFSRTTHDPVLFLGADATLTPFEVKQLVEALASPGVVAVALRQATPNRRSMVSVLLRWLTRICLLIVRGRWVGNLTPAVYMFRRAFLEKMLSDKSYSCLHPYKYAAYHHGPHRLRDVAASRMSG